MKAMIPIVILSIGIFVFPVDVAKAQLQQLEKISAPQEQKLPAYNLPAKLSERYYEQNLKAPTPEKSSQNFWNYVYAKSEEAIAEKRDEKKILRGRWKAWLGIDIFYPYYKAQEIEDWVSDRFKVKIFKMQGRPKLEDNQFKYTFKIKF